MGIRRGPNIVRDGLVFAVDAANPSSFVSGSTIWKDQTVNQNNGTLTNGPTFDSGNSGTLEFDGTDNYIELGNINSSNAISLAGTTEQTWETWIYPDGSGDDYQRIIDKSNSGGGANGYFFSLGTTSETSIFCKIAHNTSDMPNDFLATNMYTNAAWNHICVTRKNDTGDIGWNFYSNGVLKHSRSTIDVTVPTTTVGARIGSWNHSTGREFNGKIAVVRLYNKSLSSAEILHNYNALKGRFGL